MSYIATATVESGLQESVEHLLGRLMEISVASGSSPASGLDSAHILLNDSVRDGRIPLVVMLTDGEDDDYLASLRAADQLRDSDVPVVVGGIGVSESARGRLRILTSDVRNYVDLDGPAGIEKLVERTQELSRCASRDYWGNRC